MDLEFFKGILTNATWDIIKWLLIIVVGGFIARRISIKKLNVRRALEKFIINHFANYRNKLHKKVYVIKTANDNSSFVHKITECLTETSTRILKSESTLFLHVTSR